MTEKKASGKSHSGSGRNGYGTIAVNVVTPNGTQMHFPQNHPNGRQDKYDKEVEFERASPDIGDGGFRAFVLAFMDGFVTTLCFVLTVGAAAESLVLFAGVISAFAGIFSMAIGEWISMQLQNDGLEYELMSMRNFQTLNPIGAVKKLREVLGEKYGLSPKTLEAIVQDLKDSGDYRGNLVDLWSRVDMGIDPDELGGKPWKAVMMCALGYGFGAFVPLASWYIGAIWGEGFKGCVALSFIITIFVGGALSQYTTYHWSYTVGRQVFVTFLAASCVYVMGILTPQGI
ncbi:hypothetical protein AAMO2058_000437500 [Amorphochlora amoebiformis]